MHEQKHIVKHMHRRVCAVDVVDRLFVGQQTPNLPNERFPMVAGYDLA